jgi:hypothetical protein
LLLAIAQAIGMSDEILLDAYSRSVIAVADFVLPSVACLSVRINQGPSGEARSSVISPDDFT